MSMNLVLIKHLASSVKHLAPFFMETRWTYPKVLEGKHGEGMGRLTRYGQNEVVCYVLDGGEWGPDDLLRCPHHSLQRLPV